MPAYMLVVLEWSNWDAMCPSDPLNHLTLSTLKAGYLKGNLFRSVKGTSFQFVRILALAKASLLALVVELKSFRGGAYAVPQVSPRHRCMAFGGHDDTRFVEYLGHCPFIVEL